jgi:hypothetical protein
MHTAASTSGRVGMTPKGIPTARATRGLSPAAGHVTSRCRNSCCAMDTGGADAGRRWPPSTTRAALRRSGQGASTGVGGSHPSKSGTGSSAGPFAAGTSRVVSPAGVSEATAAAAETVVRAPACATVAMEGEIAAAVTHQAVLTCETVTVGTAGSMREALQLLRTELRRRGERGAEAFASGVLRLEATIPHQCSALDWLRKIPQRHAALLPRTYYRARTPPLVPVEAPGQVERACDPHVGQGAVGGAGAAVLWRARGAGATLDDATVAAVRRFLSPACPRICVMGGARFDAGRTPSVEWQDFHMLQFVLPTVEVREVGDTSFVAVTIAWDGGVLRDGGSGAEAQLEVECATTFDQAVRDASECLEAAWEAHADGREPRRFAPTEVQVSEELHRAASAALVFAEQNASKGVVKISARTLPGDFQSHRVHNRAMEKGRLTARRRCAGARGAHARVGGVGGHGEHHAGPNGGGWRRRRGGA